MKIIVFEDDKFDLLFPLSMMRPVYDIKPGAFSILQKINDTLGKDSKRVVLHCRRMLEDLAGYKRKNRINSYSSDDYLLLNGRFIFRRKFLRGLLESGFENRFFKSGDSIVYATVTKDHSGILNDRIPNLEGVIDEVFLIKSGLKREEIVGDEFSEIRYPWDVISFLLKEGIDDDLKTISKSMKKLLKAKNTVNQSEVFCSQNSRISNTSVLDASEGRIVIEKGCTIEPFVYIKGPVHIGENVLLKSGARIYGPCVIGEGSKVAGEIAESVFHSYVNKQHDGFVGHSYVCPFVNLGADTVTSDLKNNYSSIRQKFRGGDIDTGMRFLGSILGDHTKTSINTMLNTGTIAGIFANIFGGGFPAKNIRSFSWNEAGKTSEKYDFDKAIETAKIVMSRRGLKATDEYVALAGKYFADNLD